MSEIFLRLSKRFTAPPERVFDAWTTPEVLREWWAAAETWTDPRAEVDLRPGGAYRLSMRDTTSGVVQTVVGEYVEVAAPNRLSYTWAWEGEPELMRGSERTLVVVDFVADGDGTLVVLTHRGFADEHIRDLHVGGWTGCLDNLERRVFPPEGAEL
jgi:uncharacterized protein YndB with AHSA1/START domain